MQIAESLMAKIPMVLLPLGINTVRKCVVIILRTQLGSRLGTRVSPMLDLRSSRRKNSESNCWLDILHTLNWIVSWHPVQITEHKSSNNQEESLIDC